jgi:type I site-specific restriction endonuclease
MGDTSRMARECHVRICQEAQGEIPPAYSGQWSGNFLRGEKRSRQSHAPDEIARGFDSNARHNFLLEVATGTGKTLLCAALIRRFLVTRNAERVLLIVDRIELAKQNDGRFHFACQPGHANLLYRQPIETELDAEVRRYA